MFSISSIQHREKIATLLIFYYKVSAWMLPINVERERNIFCQEVDVVKNKNLKEVTVEQLQAEARCIIQHPGLGETGEG